MQIGVNTNGMVERSDKAGEVSLNANIKLAFSSFVSFGTFIPNSISEATFTVE